MKKLLWIVVFGIWPAWTAPAHAQLFSKKAKPNPVQRVPELIVTLKSEGDDRKRAHAAGELGTFDAKVFPEIPLILIDTVQSDAKPAVRYEAVSSLASLRPVSPAAGMALEKAASSDDAWKVRWHAKTVLVKYRLAGYSTPRNETKGPMLVEAPIQGAKVEVKPGPAPAKFPTATVVNRPVPGTGNPNLPTGAQVARPLPQGPTFTTAVPQQPQATRTTVPMVETGPELTPVPPPPPARNPF